MRHFQRVLPSAPVLGIVLLLGRSALAADDVPPSAAFPIDEPAQSGAVAKPAPAPKPGPPAPAVAPPVPPPAVSPSPAPRAAPEAAPPTGAVAEKANTTDLDASEAETDLSESDVLSPKSRRRDEARSSLSGAAQDPDAVFRAFARYADTERRLRIGTAIGGVVAGAAAIGMGVAFADYFKIAPEPFYLLGGIAAVAPLVGLFSSSAAEGYARQIGAGEPGHTEAEALALRRNWAGFASNARARRHWSAGTSFVLGAISLGFGIAILDGAFNMRDNDRILWGSVLMGTAGATAASGVSSLLVLTPIEAAYEQLDATLPLPKGPTVAASAGLGGAELRLGLRF